MRIAFLTDLHGNLEALDAALDAIETLAVDQIVVLGDLVGYGPDPVAVVERISALVGKGAVCIKGNHDHAACTTSAGMTECARFAIEWTRLQLCASHLDYLAALPMAVRDEDRFYVHSSAYRPGNWHYLRNAEAAAKSFGATDARLTFAGHTHVPAVYQALPGQHPALFMPQTGTEIALPFPHRAVVVVGSAGQPRDGNPAASFALFDTGTQMLTMLRAPYDFTRTAGKIRTSGLPIWLADRLAIGK
jgi:diadenosine tetraphosphatase ApaH/serine/threonine PP2A family protein phosphatase